MCSGRRPLHRNHASLHFPPTSSCSPVRLHNRGCQSCRPKVARRKTHRCGGDWVWAGFAHSQRLSCPRHLQSVAYSVAPESFSFPTSSAWRLPFDCVYCRSRLVPPWCLVCSFFSCSFSSPELTLIAKASSSHLAQVSVLGRPKPRLNSALNTCR